MSTYHKQLVDGSAADITKVIQSGIASMSEIDGKWQQKWVGPRHLVLVSKYDSKTFMIERLYDDETENPWQVFSHQLRPVINQIVDSSLLDFRFKNNRAMQLDNMTLKYEHGKIEFRGGKLFIYGVGNLEAFLAEVEKLKSLFDF